MKQSKHNREWMTIPSLPCVEIEETLSFWEILGFKVTYKMTRPYQYGVIERGGYELHFGRVKGMDTASNLYNGCLIMISDAREVYKEFTKKFKENLGRVPHVGIPRISRMKPDATRFTLTDVSGNSILFISDNEEDEEIWEKADSKNQSSLQQSIARAIRFRDFKEDEYAASKTLDVALRKIKDEAQIEIAEALIIRIDLANTMGDRMRSDECKTLLNQLNLEEKEIVNLARRHDVDLH